MLKKVQHDKEISSLKISIKYNHKNCCKNFTTKIPNTLPKANPTIPTAMPGAIRSLFFMAFEMAGINGGLIIPAAEVMIMVSVSMLNILQKTIWINTEPKRIMKVNSIYVGFRFNTSLK